MNLVPSKFEIDSFSSHDLYQANYTDENSLLKSNPKLKMWEDVTDNVLEYVASASPNIYGKETSLISFFTKRKAVKTVTSEWIRWSLKGTGKVKAYSMENMMPGNATPGINHSEILIKTDKQTWVPSDTVYPEIAPTVEFSVQGPGVSDGNGWIWRLVLHNRSDMAFVDPYLLSPRLVWCKRGSKVSEGSSEYGSSSIQGTSIITFQSTLSSWSKSHKVTDKGWYTMLRLRAYDSNNMHMPAYKDQVIAFSEAEFLYQSKYEKEQTMFWGRDAGKNILDGSTGLYRRTGPGMLEWYEDGNMRHYHDDNFTVKFLRDLFVRFFYGKVPPGKADITVNCGIALLNLVDEALNAEYAKKPIQFPKEQFMRAGATFPGSKTAGAHLSEPTIYGFDLKPYGTIKFEHLAILDDFEMNGGLVHPRTQMPLTSYWGFVNDIGLGQTNNLEMLRLKNSQVFVYTCGVHSPVGPLDGRTGRSGFSSAHGERSYKLHAHDVFGTRVKDTKRTLFLHPAITY